MKKQFTLFIFFSFLILQSCTKDECKQEVSYKLFLPVYVLPDEFSVPAEILPAKELRQPGKIYFYRDYILINEVREGIHIINNADPSKPVNERFIAIKGNVDMAIRNDLLYADSYTDLVIIDLKDMNRPEQISRNKGIFNSYYHVGGTGAILSHFQETEENIRVDCSNPNWGMPWFPTRDGGILVDAFNFDTSAGWVGANGSGAPEMTGQGGSMARFTISNAHLYVIGDAELYALPILANGQTGDASRVSLPWGIETIFPYHQYLFVGANNGLHILDIQNPKLPVHVSTFAHARACDPVVVQNNIAFVTLRDGNECAGYINQLEVIDVKDVLNPKLLHSFPMQHPHGLAVSGDFLYLCEGKWGLKVFDIKDLSQIDRNMVSHLKGFHAWDAIAVTNRSLLVIGEDGFRQYDYSNPAELKLLSKIEPKK